MTELDIPKWLTQMNKGYLELCVLEVLHHHKRCYGAQILECLSAAKLEINEGTLYPLLNRMHRNGWLISDWVPPQESGHPRRYYTLTPEALTELPFMRTKFTSQYEIIERLKS